MSKDGFIIIILSTYFFLLVDCGDHVVVINSKKVAFPGDEWRRRVYFHHTGYQGGATWTPAWELHGRDPTLVCYLKYLTIVSVFK